VEKKLENRVTKPEPVIKIQNLHKSFGDLSVLKGVDIVANKGEVISLIGSSGSGKSTLLRCANLLENSQQGKIFFDGEEIKWRGTGEDRAPADANQVRLMRTNLSMVFQQFNLWSHMTVLQNVMEAPVSVLGIEKEKAKKNALDYLNKVGIEKNGTHIHLSCQGDSSNEPQLQGPCVWSPAHYCSTSRLQALDPELEQEVIKVIKDLAREGEQ
jgi:polar amino acid transport system ATP-binding protein